MTKVGQIKLKKIPKAKINPKKGDKDITAIKFKKPSPNVILKNLEKRKKNTIESMIDEALEGHAS